MRIKTRPVRWIVTAVIVLPALVFSQAILDRLQVGGYPGSLPVTHFEGRNYVEIEALAQLVGGSLTFTGSKVVFTFPGGALPEAEARAKKGLSSDFLRAANEEISTIREWHSVLVTAVENQFPVVPEVLGPYEAQAAKNLRLAQVAATTEDDQSASQMVADHYQQMKQLSDKYLAQRAAANYINADALNNDSLNQNVIACGHALGAMIAARQFTSDASCQ
jgi:hypothetical protein